MKALPFKNKLVIAITGLLILFLLPMMTLGFLLREKDESGAGSNLIKFEYCGANPTVLCVLSFGRDGAGNAIINFFVPDADFPAFYLIVKKAGMESRYECTANLEVTTSVFCSGTPLSLKQTIEIHILAIEEDQLLATGSFFIEALLVSTQAGVLVESSPSIIPTLTSTAAVATIVKTPTTGPVRTAYPNPYP